MAVTQQHTLERLVSEIAYYVVHSVSCLLLIRAVKSYRKCRIGGQELHVVRSRWRKFEDSV